MVTRVGALESPDVGRPSRYRGWLRTTPRKIFWAIWKKSFIKKSALLEREGHWRAEISTQFFEKSLLFHVCFNKKWLWCRMITRAGALESPDVGGPSRYIGWLRTTPRNFLRAYKVTVSPRKGHFLLILLMKDRNFEPIFEKSLLLHVCFDKKDCDVVCSRELVRWKALM